MAEGAGRQGGVSSEKSLRGHDGNMQLTRMILSTALLVWCAHGKAQTVPSPNPPNPSWNWINVGVAAEAMGNSLDWATSWKQPEGNSLLAQTGGQYSGELYRTGTNRKIAVAGGLAILSYAVGWKWPKLRKYVGIFDMVGGATWTGVAFSNVARNPYYR